ncbi:heterogeneous nuclear ribonucleoprotein R isoform X2 [Oncorhynchus nerka]
MATEHINGNGPEEPMDTTAAVTHSEHFQTLLEAGLPQKVAEKLDEIYIAGLVSHSDLDDRAIEALKEFNEEGALQVLLQFKDSDLSHVQNKSAFLCGVMKTYRQREKQGTKVSDSSKGPDEAKIKALLERTGYTLDVTTGQRKYGGPPPESDHSGTQPTIGTEIFVGKIPRDLFEDELVPLFEKAGPIWDQRLQKAEELKRGLKSRQALFKKAKSQGQAAVKASFILAEEIAKSARPFTEGDFIKNCMIKVCDEVCPEKRQLFLNVSLSRNTIAERVDQLSINLKEQLVKREKILLHIPWLWMRAPTFLTLPSCQFSSAEWTPT